MQYEKWINTNQNYFEVIRNCLDVRATFERIFLKCQIEISSFMNEKC